MSNINSLSSLIKTPIHLEIMETSDPLEVEVIIKTEAIKEECEDTYDCPNDTCNSDNGPSDDFFEAMGDESLLPALNNQSEAKGDVADCGGAVDDDDNASFKSLLNRKSKL